MAVVMNMSSYEIEHDGASEAGYGDEVLCAGWNPVVMLACQQIAPGWHDRHAAMPAELANVDAETFLQKMYAYQR